LRKTNSGNAASRAVLRGRADGADFRENSGAPEGSRTPNPQIRSLVLYPIELRVRSGAGFSGDGFAGQPSTAEFGQDRVAHLFCGDRGAAGARNVRRAAGGGQDALDRGFDQSGVFLHVEAVA
jgi:hypothetical protein